MDFQTVNLMLGKSFLLNCQIFIVTLLLALPLGLLLSFGTMSRIRPVSALSKLYVYLMRSTPLMLQLAIVYYLPGFLNPGHMLSRMTAACLAFVLNFPGWHPGGSPRTAGSRSSAWHDEVSDLFQGYTPAGDQAHCAAYGQRGHHTH